MFMHPNITYTFIRICTHITCTNPFIAYVMLGILSGRAYQLVLLHQRLLALAKDLHCLVHRCMDSGDLDEARRLRYIHTHIHFLNIYTQTYSNIICIHIYVYHLLFFSLLHSSILSERWRCVWMSQWTCALVTCWTRRRPHSAEHSTRQTH